MLLNKKYAEESIRKQASFSNDGGVSGKRNGANLIQFETINDEDIIF